MIEHVLFGSGLITVEYQLAPHMVVFSHDFGVLRDDDGLLRDVAVRLPHGFGYVLFDYYDTDAGGQRIQVKMFAEQIQRLGAVLDWVRQQAGVEHTSILGHALGCIVAAKLHPAGIERMLLLAPPTVIGDDLRLYTEKTGATEKAGIWHVRRPDGVEVSIPDSFFNEISRVEGANELYELALLQEYTLILPEIDEILSDADYTELIVLPGVHAEVVEGANHYFENESRNGLISIVNGLLLGQRTEA